MTEVLKFTILDAGLVETAVISRPGIEACGLVPYFNKLVHDTLPVLYVVPDEKGSGGVKAVKKGDTLIDVRLIHLDDFQRRIGGGVPDELEHDAEMIMGT